MGRVVTRCRADQPKANRVRSGVLLGLTVSVAIGLTSLGASAAPVAPNVPPQVTGAKLDALEAERKGLFQQMLKDPGNVPLALKYAQLSSLAGDLEGAISTLERLLIYAPNVGELNYQLGILYLRLGAFSQASADFKAAAAAPDATPDMKAAAAKYAGLADRQAVGDFVVASATLGARYQTNANGGAAVRPSASMACRSSSTRPRWPHPMRMATSPARCMRPRIWRTRATASIST